LKAQLTVLFSIMKGRSRGCKPEIFFNLI
jgi:hypothetical protein